MNMEIYHQLGHNHSWNLESMSHDHVGDGVILAPRYMARSVVENLPSHVKAGAIFDPQFFLPGTARGKLSTYHFFPDLVAGGFETEAYSSAAAAESARLCVEFQLAENYRYIVIPTRHMDGMPTNMTDQQQELFVDPFIHAVRQSGTTKPVALQLILNSPMIRDEIYLSHILNWVTGITGVDAIYLIAEVTPRRTKQLVDIDTIYNMLNLISVLGENGMDVIAGYLNLEALLLSIANPKIVTVGSYEAQRIFNLRAFREDDGKKMTGPTPRLYVSRLLQSIDHNYIGAINRALPAGMDVYDHNAYQALMFEKTYQWWFTKPELYKHFFLEFSEQLNMVAVLEPQNRYNAVRRMITTAQTWYSRLQRVALDEDSSGAHLNPWLTAIDQFAADQGWD